MPISANISGTWHTVSQPYVNISGVWKAAKNAWANVSGVWELAYTAMSISLSASSGSTSIAGFYFYAPTDSKAFDHAVVTITGGTAPISMALNKVSGAAGIVVAYSPDTYGDGYGLSTSNNSTGTAVFNITATDANGISVTSSNFTLTVT